MSVWTLFRFNPMIIFLRLSEKCPIVREMMFQLCLFFYAHEYLKFCFVFFFLPMNVMINTLGIYPGHRVSISIHNALIIKLLNKAAILYLNYVCKGSRFAFLSYHVGHSLILKITK